MKISITDTYVERENVIANVMNVDYRELDSFIMGLGKRAWFGTGLLPPGLLSYRQAGDHTQIVLQLPPAVNLVTWGVYERDTNAHNYTLAQPYRIIIVETNKNQMLGMRMFYSPVPITRGDQILYHQNLPNLNCKGYNGTAVGWVCLYHTEDWKAFDLAARVARAGLRASGNEAYNDRNMSGTDGPRFYEAQYKAKYKTKADQYSFLWNPQEWEKKSEQEGYEWTLNEQLWIPVLVTSMDAQDEHNPKGKPLTLDWAMNGKAKFYYQDEKVKDFFPFVRTDVEQPKVVAWAQAAYAESKAATPPATIPMGDAVLPDFGGGGAPVLPGFGEMPAVLPDFAGVVIPVIEDLDEANHPG